MKTTIIILFLVMGVTAGCYYDNEEELYNCVVDPATIKYSTTIATIMNSYGCTNPGGCHGGGAPIVGIDLTTYAGVKAVVDPQQRLSKAINQTGPFPMPRGGSKMNECDIRKVQAWIDAGTPQ